MLAKDGCSSDKTLEIEVTSYEQKICILTSNFAALKKEMSLEQGAETECRVRVNQ